ncbi:uncharacterized protein KD926_002378 [Aspergillus affinis]|uniref:uncharacterized protein n=1 Tax=Aspergillus affinis TaxID=1070780 RepID=UPI0022FDFBAF|nr:uncharacterized protein KD926_002378 [Aspergillus affinis]KAI9043999.1 hypothetical protein KD926_002378 [Aspergillus affinis]
MANNDGNPNYWDPYANPPGQVHTTWDLEGMPHTVAENGPQPTNEGQWTTDVWTTAAATATESWASQVTSDASTSQTQSTDTATTTLSFSTTTKSSETSSTTTDTTTTTTSSTTSATSTSTATATNTPNSSNSGLSTKTKIAIAVPISIVGTALLAALLFFLFRRRRRHKSPRSGPYMDIRENPSRNIPSHSHSDSHGGQPSQNPWDSMSQNLWFMGGTPGAIGASNRSIRTASERNVSAYDVTNPNPRYHPHYTPQGEGAESTDARASTPNLHRGFHRPSLIVSDGFIPDPLHSHPNTPTRDDAPAPPLGLGGGGGTPRGSIGLARTTTPEPGHQDSLQRSSRSRTPDPDTNNLHRPRPHSSFNHDPPLDDAVSEISRFSGHRNTLYGGHGTAAQGHYRGIGDRGSISSVSSVSSVSDNEDNHSRR